MRFLVVLLGLLLLSCGEQQADITGQWEWQHTNQHNEKHIATVQLNAVNNDKVVGFYCSAFGNGEYVDCAGSDSADKDVPNLVLKRISPVKFSGTLQSNRGDANDVKGKIEVTYFTATDELSFDILQEPSGEFYFPDEVEFERK